MNTKQMTVEEIKNYLFNDHGIDRNILDNIKGKANLVNFMNSLPDGPILMENNIETNKDMSNLPQTAFEFFEISEPKLTSHESKMEQPNITDPQWSNFILNQLSDDEKDQNYPKADGLRRLVEKYISKIKSIRTEVVQTPNDGNQMTSTVKTAIYLENGEVYEACTDVQKIHCPAPYDKHISAVAETRAEGRAYRKILRLKNVVTKEEMTGGSDYEDNDKINKTQLSLIDLLCSPTRLNINVLALFNMVLNTKVESIKNCTHSDGIKVSEILSLYQEDMSKIPNEIRGYNSGWRD